MRLASPVSAVLALALLSPLTVLAQPAQPTPSISVPRLIKFSGVFQPADGQPPASMEVVTLSVYAEQEGGVALWQEMQTVAVDTTGRFTVLLGASRPEGLPPEVFGSGEAQWMGLQFTRDGDVAPPRVRIASVPYALKAEDAETLGGRPASAYVLAPADGDKTHHAGGATAGDASVATAQPIATANLIQPGTTNFLAKYVNSADVGNSAVYEIGGKVGIGTTTPKDGLHVRFTNTTGGLTGFAVQNLGNTATSYSGMLFYDQFGAVGQFQGFNNVTHEYRINNIASNGSFNFSLGGISKFLVAPNGNVGISTVLPAHRLTVIGGPAWTVNGWIGAVALDNGSAIGWYANGAGNRFGIGHTNGGLYFFRTASNPGTTGSAATYDMVINDAGHVGIGVSTPNDAKLQVAASNTTGILATSQGNAILGYSGTPNFAAIYGENNTTGGNGVYGKANLNSGVRGDGYYGVYGSGHFGVFGTSSNGGYGVYGECSGSGCWSGFFAGGVKVNSTLVANGIQVETLGSGGSIELCLSNPLHFISVCSSSLRYKTNVTAFHSGLTLIDRLRPITFDWKTGGEADLGLAAEEVAEVEPLLVTHNATGEVEGVKYDRISVLLINAIKEQQAQLRQQQAQLEQQRGEIETLRRRQEELVALKALICADHHAAAECQ